MIKQDIIKAREQLSVEEAMERGDTFERTYKAIREVLDLLINQRQTEVMKNSVSIKISEYTDRRLKSLGIAFREYPFYHALFRLERL